MSPPWLKVFRSGLLRPHAAATADQAPGGSGEASANVVVGLVIPHALRAAIVTESSPFLLHMTDFD
jgi:hypothetical protein